MARTLDSRLRRIAHRAPAFAQALRGGICAVAAGATVAAMGCAGGVTPQDTVREYARAVDRGDSDRAWALTAPEARSATSRARFNTDFASEAAAGESYTDALRRAADGSAELHAELPYSDFETATLAYVDGAWVITGGVGDFFSQATPRDTLRTFIRAVQSQDTQALMPLIPGEFRAQIEEDDLATWLEARSVELEQTVALLLSSVDAPIRERDGEAWLRYGSHEMSFVSENGRWVISDFD